MKYSNCDGPMGLSVPIVAMALTARSGKERFGFSPKK
jgi:hypothetical protein